MALLDTWRAPAWIYLLDLVLVSQAVRFRRLVWLLPGIAPVGAAVSTCWCSIRRKMRATCSALYMMAVAMSLLAGTPRHRYRRLAEIADEYDEFDDDDSDDVARCGKGPKSRSDQTVRQPSSVLTPPASC